MGKKVKVDLVRIYERYSKEYGQVNSPSTSKAQHEDSVLTQFAVESHGHKARCATFTSHLEKERHHWGKESSGKVFEWDLCGWRWKLW